MELRARIPGLLVLASVCPPAGENRPRSPEQPGWAPGLQENGNHLKPPSGVSFFKVEMVVKVVKTKLV